MKLTILNAFILSAFVLEQSWAAESANLKDIKSCYKGIGLAKLKTDCDDGVKNCATVHVRNKTSSLTNIYFCGEKENMTDCDTVDYSGKAASFFGLNSKHETCFCSEDNCNSFGVSIAPVAWVTLVAWCLISAWGGF
eukprot:maker-scaffold21_size687808-snap-gene-5.41 protein:Tk09846 transcript:maker-scaffold21_size687808-snap-gene-5.41-mRNA-1 annotation:"conserved hypothetical protein"